NPHIPALPFTLPFRFIPSISQHLDRNAFRRGVTQGRRGPQRDEIAVPTPQFAVSPFIPRFPTEPGGLERGGIPRIGNGTLSPLEAFELALTPFAHSACKPGIPVVREEQEGCSLTVLLAHEPQGNIGGQQECRRG